MKGLGFGVWGFGVWFRGSGFGVWGFGVWFRGLGLGPLELGGLGRLGVRGLGSFWLLRVVASVLDFLFQ